VTVRVALPAVQRFASFDGTQIAYVEEGRGPLVLLLHGFGGDHVVNWVRPGVVAALVAAGYHVVATDARGHGASDKPHDPAAYEGDAMVRDAQAMLDLTGSDAVFVVGYSMGALTTARLAVTDARVRAVVLGGIGARLTNGRGSVRRSVIADALEADDPRAVRNVVARAFRRFADHTGADRHALAALQRARSNAPSVIYEDITVPALVVVGNRDAIAGDAHALAAQMGHGRAEIVRGTHLGAVNDPAFARTIVNFLNSVR
jgi:pimeloyl-ACP methyl ester carboxylesterase